MDNLSQALRDLLINSGVCTMQVTDVTVAVSGGIATVTGGTIKPLQNDGALFVDTAQIVEQDTGGGGLSVSNWLAYGLKITAGNQVWQFAGAGTESHDIGLLVGGPITCTFVNPASTATVNAHIYVVTISIPQAVYGKLLGATYRALNGLPLPGARQ